MCVGGGELGEKGGGWVSDGRREGETGRDSEKKEKTGSRGATHREIARQENGLCG